MSKLGAKLIEVMQEAIEGNFARVTVDGVTWVRSSELVEANTTIAELREWIVMADNRIDAALLGDEVCKACVDVAQSYLKEALKR